MDDTHKHLHKSIGKTTQLIPGKVCVLCVDLEFFPGLPVTIATVQAEDYLGMKAPLVSEGSSSSSPSNSCDLEEPDDVSALGRTLVAGRGVSL